jgi:hypothetical protein
MGRTMNKLFIIIFSAVTLLISTNAAAKRENILIVESYHPVLAWTAQCERGIQSVLGSKYKLHYFYMDTKRIPKSEFGKRADMAWEKYLEIKPELVMIGDDNGLRLLGPKFSKTSTPIVFFGINNNPRYYYEKNELPKNISGVLERTPIVPWIRYLGKMFPDAKAALVLLDSSPTSKAIIDVVFQERRVLRIGGFTVERRISKNWPEWKNIVKNSGKYDLIVMPTFHSVKDEAGVIVSVEDVVEWTSANTPIPVFSNQDYTVSSKGVIGAYVIYGEAHGRLAGQIALGIMENKQGAYTIKSDTKGKFYFNKDQLDRFKLTLPKEISEQAVFQ